MNSGWQRVVVITCIIMIPYISFGFSDLDIPKSLSDTSKKQSFADKDDDLVEDLMKSQKGIFDSILVHSREWNVQIIYTQINRDGKGNPNLKSYYYNKNEGKYFYPASTVKLAIAALALQKMQSLTQFHLSRNTTMITEAAYSGQTPVYNAPNTADGRPTIGNYIKEMLMVSDNDAFNRLYEFLGQEYINKELYARGYKNTQILHRLGIDLSEDENRHTNPITFYDSNNKVIYSQPMLYNTVKYSSRNDSLGKSYMKGAELIAGSMNFSGKNRMSLDELNNVLISLIFPEKVNPAQRFTITEDDRRFILKHISQLPAESIYPSYDSSYNDAYAKFILFGGGKMVVPKNIRIFNKVGDAYGQLSDVAYVVDFDKKIEFFVSATIYCNSDNILNDDNYDYEKTGLPFLKNLGKVLFDYELKRKRNNLPDLSPMIFTYDK